MPFLTIFSVVLLLVSVIGLYNLYVFSHSDFYRQIIKRPRNIPYDGTVQNGVLFTTLVIHIGCCILLLLLFTIFTILHFYNSDTAPSLTLTYLVHVMFSLSITIFPCYRIYQLLAAIFTVRIVLLVIMPPILGFMAYTISLHLQHVVHFVHEDGIGIGAVFLTDFHYQLFLTTLHGCWLTLELVHMHTAVNRLVRTRVVEGPLTSLGPLFPIAFTPQSALTSMIMLAFDITTMLLHAIYGAGTLLSVAPYMSLTLALLQVLALPRPSPVPPSRAFQDMFADPASHAFLYAFLQTGPDSWRFAYVFLREVGCFRLACRLRSDTAELEAGRILDNWLHSERLARVPGVHHSIAADISSRVIRAGPHHLMEVFEPVERACLAHLDEVMPAFERSVPGRCESLFHLLVHGHVSNISRLRSTIGSGFVPKVNRGCNPLEPLPARPRREQLQDSVRRIGEDPAVHSNAPARAALGVVSGVLADPSIPLRRMIGKSEGGALKNFIPSSFNSFGSLSFGSFSDRQGPVPAGSGWEAGDLLAFRELEEGWGRDIPLSRLLVSAVHVRGLHHVLPLRPERLAVLGELIQADIPANPFTDSRRASCCFHTYMTLLSMLSVSLIADDMPTLFASILAAACRFLGDPGLDQPYLLSTQHATGVLYGPHHPVTQQAAAWGWRLVRKSRVLEGISKSKLQTIRSAYIALSLDYAPVTGGEVISSHCRNAPQIRSDMNRPLPPRPTPEDRSTRQKLARIVTGTMLHLALFSDLYLPVDAHYRLARARMLQVRQQSIQGARRGVPAGEITPREELTVSLMSKMQLVLLRHVSQLLEDVNAPDPACICEPKPISSSERDLRRPPPLVLCDSPLNPVLQACLITVHSHHDFWLNRLASSEHPSIRPEEVSTPKPSSPLLVRGSPKGLHTLRVKRVELDASSSFSHDSVEDGFRVITNLSPSMLFPQSSE